MRKLIFLVVAVSIAALFTDTWAQGPGKAPVRAKNPKFPPSVTDLFGADAREGLTGDRPANFGGGAPTAVGGTPTGTPVANPGSGTPPAAGAFSWSKIATADAIQNEIKSFKALLLEEVKTPPLFKAAGSKRARRIFSEFAALFAVITEYDGEIRWKKEAAVARDAFAHCAANCKVATDGSFKETKDRLEDLETLVGGGSLAGSGEAKNDWPKIADRRQIMVRMEELQKQIQEMTSSEGEFKKAPDKVAHLAQILAVLTAVCNRPGYEYFDDKDFGKYVDDLVKSCQDATSGSNDKNYDTVRKAIGEGTKACANCHSGYRS